jgi:NADH:ubiquinone oxidoreductase subunit 2 (subunit N)
MYMHEPAAAAPELPALGGALGTVLWASALGILALGIYPGIVLEFVNHSASLAR